MNSSRRSSVIKLGAHRKSMSQTKPSPSNSILYPLPTNVPNSITDDIDKRIKWTYSSFVNSRIKDVSSTDTRFPNDLLNEYISYVYKNYQIEDPLLKITRQSEVGVDFNTNSFKTPSKSILDNDTKAGTIRSTTNSKRFYTPKEDFSPFMSDRASTRKQEKILSSGYPTQRYGGIRQQQILDKSNIDQEPRHSILQRKIKKVASNYEQNKGQGQSSQKFSQNKN